MLQNFATEVSLELMGVHFSWKKRVDFLHKFLIVELHVFLQDLFFQKQLS